MNSAAVAVGAASPHAGGSSLPAQIALVARRSVRRTLRQPAYLAPPLIMPLMLLTINAAGLADAPKIPGFPADSYLDFMLVLTFLQGALFATVTSGLAIGQDLEQGFLDRLALTPMRGPALILGQLAGAAALIFLTSFGFVAYGALLGVNYRTGLPGIAVLIALAVLTAIAFSSVGAMLALRAGTAEAVQGLFPVLFATLFLSTLNMPLELIEADWFRAIAQVNPVSYMVDGMRSLIITGWDLEALAINLAIVLALLVAALTGASFALRGRLTRT